MWINNIFKDIFKVSSVYSWILFVFLDIERINLKKDFPFFYLKNIIFN